MKRILSLLAALCSISGFASIKFANQAAGVYGEDGRQDLYQITNQSTLKLAASTAAMIPNKNLIKDSTGKFFSVANATTLEEGDNLCPTEKFSEQPSVAMCSGFLIGPDTLVTAGHCMDAVQLPGACPNFSWVFDYKMQNANTINLNNISKDNVYRCKSIIIQKLSMDVDYSVIKLDRPVVGRQALKLRSSGAPAMGQKLIVIGNPSGLPTKITDGNIIGVDNANFFKTNLDTFHGNSGSAVFNAATGEVEGILVRGKTDYVPSIPSNPFSCKIMNKCDMSGNNCTTGPKVKDLDSEQVTRISFILPYVKKSGRRK
ncbi:MAG: trypsin-like serine peptidase [Bacteriovoracaceae bacterium]